MCFKLSNSRAKVQVTGHRSGYRSQVTGQATGQVTGHTKTIGHGRKLFLIDILLYKNKTNQGTSIIFFSVLNFTKFHT